MIQEIKKVYTKEEKEEMNTPKMQTKQFVSKDGKWLVTETTITSFTTTSNVARMVADNLVAKGITAKIEAANIDKVDVETELTK